MAAPRKDKKPVILVSSTVYGIEELLERIYAILTQFGYEVWSSHAGTMPTNSNLSAFDNCIEAVRNCNLFLGNPTTTYYGSGVVWAATSRLPTRNCLPPSSSTSRDGCSRTITWCSLRKLLEKLGHATPEQRARSSPCNRRPFWTTYA